MGLSVIEVGRYRADANPQGLGRLPWHYQFALLLVCLPEALNIAFTGHVQEELYRQWIHFKFALPFSIVLIAALVIRGGGAFFAVAVIAVLFGTFSMVIGAAMGWGVKDIIADGARIMAPALTALVTFALLQRASCCQIIEFLRKLLSLYAIVLIGLVLRKVYSVLVGFDWVEYALWGYLPSFLLVAFALHRQFGRVLSAFVLCCAVMAPVLVASKSAAVAIWGGVAMGLRKRVWVLVLMLPVAIVGLMLFKPAPSVTSAVLVERFELFAEGVLNFDVADLGDGSTLARVSEAQNALHRQFVIEPESIVFGQGSGALWYDDLGVYTSGLSHLNFRDGGGAHHIHLTYIAILYRYGVTGLAIFLSYLALVVWVVNQPPRNEWYASVKPALQTYVCAVLLYSLFDYAIYDTFEFSVIAGVAAALNRGDAAAGSDSLIDDRRSAPVAAVTTL